MNAPERAKLKRIDKRRDKLFKALAVIHTWLGFPDDPQERIYRIGQLVAEQLEAEREAQRKEELRDMAKESEVEK